MSESQLGSIPRSILAGLAGMLIYGSWAYFANRVHGGGAAWDAALTQGVVSFSATFGVTWMMEVMSRAGSGRLSRFLLPFVGGLGLAASYTVGMHIWNDTPEILRTVAPSLTIGTAYCFIYSSKLAHAAIPPDFQAATV